MRATNFPVAIWFAIFALPLFFRVRERPLARAAGESASAAWRAGLRRLLVTLGYVRRRPNVLRYLLAQMIYTDGLNTLFAFGGIYAAGTFGMGVAEVVQSASALNVVAGLGAAGFGWVDDRAGAKRTVAIGLAGLAFSGAALLLVRSKTAFWILGFGLSVFFGPVQAASRSLMARLAPPERQTQLFGFYALTGKAIAFIGPAILAATTEYFRSQRAGMASVLIFFVVGSIVLAGVREPARRRLRHADS